MEINSGETILILFISFFYDGFKNGFYAFIFNQLTLKDVFNYSQKKKEDPN
ncbi:MAG: hypothetical protein BAJALOKI3v1_580008 [Promethearchaeota archaeon]|nr:MAG: hypothetical protein BAJALOKI3v1_580008 [Candidatus Lokiarchaeota archaeon]